MANVTKDRAWTRLLEAAGSRAVNHPRFEHTLTRRKLIAEMVLESITTGEIQYLDGKKETLTASEWVSFVKWLYNHIDGPPVAKVQMSSPPGEPFQVEDVTPMTMQERVSRLKQLSELAQSRANGNSNY